MRQTAILLNLVILALLVGGCGPSQRQKTIHAALVATNAARDGFVVWDKAHQDGLVAKAESREAGAATIAAYRQDRETVVKAFEAMYRTIAIAAILNDSPLDLSALAVETAKLVETINAFIQARK